MWAELAHEARQQDASRNFPVPTDTRSAATFVPKMDEIMQRDVIPTLSASGPQLAQRYFVAPPTEPSLLDRVRRIATGSEEAPPPLYRWELGTLIIMSDGTWHIVQQSLEAYPYLAPRGEDYARATTLIPLCGRSSAGLFWAVGNHRAHAMHSVTSTSLLIARYCLHHNLLLPGMSS